ncbi:MAG: radical SAM protein [Caldilinea sp. CFX5]|nr:radical SAM protein [Caldilinea sp. CFX5]
MQQLRQMAPMGHGKSAPTPLGLWQYFPATGLNVLDTDVKAERWQPLNVSIAITGRCYKGCPFCYASSTKVGTTHWRYDELLAFITDLDQNNVFSVMLGGGEPTLWADPQAGKDFYDLVNALYGRVALALTFTTSGIPALQVERLPDLPLRLSCHTPDEAATIIARADRCRQSVSQVGINLLLWRSQLDACRQAVAQFVVAGYHDILLLTMLPAGFGLQFAAESLSATEVAAFIKSLGVENALNAIRLTACQPPPPRMRSSDMGCGANDWFVSISEEKVVKACSFIDSGQLLPALTYQGLLAATQHLPRLPCYRPYQTSQIGQIALHE